MTTETKTPMGRKTAPPSDPQHIPPTDAERIESLESKVQFLQNTLNEILPALLDWCEKVDNDRKALFENDQKLKTAIVATINGLDAAIPVLLVR